jgi:hypothetical protein
MPFKKTIEWMLNDKCFSLVSDDSLGHLSIDGSPSITLDMDEWKALAEAIGQFSFPEKPNRKMMRYSGAAANAGQPWTAEQDHQLTELWKSGTSVEALAQEFGRTSGSISSRLVRLGICTTREEAQSHTTRADSHGEGREEINEEVVVGEQVLPGGAG